MANKHYVRGRRFEYELINLLKKYLPSDKYTIIRTAGSHSPVDVIVLKHVGRKYYGIQAKTETLAKKFKKQYSGDLK